MKRASVVFAVVLAIVWALAACSRQQPSACAALARLNLPNTSITATEEMPLALFAAARGIHFPPSTRRAIAIRGAAAFLSDHRQDCARA